MADGDEMTDREREAIEERAGEIEDADCRYSTKEVVEDLDIELETNDDRVARNLMGEPHIVGRRIPVRQLRALVEEGGENAEMVADRFNLDVADVYHALAYYHDHPREMYEVEREREASRKCVAQLEDDENFEDNNGLLDDLPDAEE